MAASKIPKGMIEISIPCTVVRTHYSFQETTDGSWGIIGMSFKDFKENSRDDSTIAVKEHVVTILVPEVFDVRQAKVELLRKKEQRILADAEHEANQVRGEIQKLLALNAPQD